MNRRPARSDDPRVYADDLHQMEWGEYLGMVEEEKQASRRRDNDWLKILLLAVIAALMIVGIVAVSGMTHAVMP